MIIAETDFKNFMMNLVSKSNYIFSIFVVFSVLAVNGLQAEKPVLRFKVSARNLAQKDTGILNGVSDPFVEVFDHKEGTANEQDLGKSATINNDLNPDWTDIFEVDYEVDAKWNQSLIFRLYDKDNFGANEKLGTAVVNTQEFVANGQQLTVNIKPRGALTLYGNQPGGIKCYECVSHSKFGVIQNPAFGEKSCIDFYNSQSKDKFIKNCRAGTVGCTHTFHEFEDGIDKVERHSCYAPRHHQQEFNSFLKSHGCNQFKFKKTTYKVCRCSSDLCILGGFRL